MKRCMNCNINVGGHGSQCPICQNGLVGEDTLYNWPSMKKLKLQSVFYKLQLFIVLALSAVSLSLDFLLDLHMAKHWSIPVVMWSITLELLIRSYIRKNVVVAEVVSLSIFHICIMLSLTAWYMGGVSVIVGTVVPIFISALSIINLILAFADKKGNAMVYLLINILVGVATYVIMAIAKTDIPLTWTICLMISVVTFIGICVFKGRGVVSEIQKRMYI